MTYFVFSAHKSKSPNNPSKLTYIIISYKSVLLDKFNFFNKKCYLFVA